MLIMRSREEIIIKRMFAIWSKSRLIDTYTSDIINTTDVNGRKNSKYE